MADTKLADEVLRTFRSLGVALDASTEDDMLRRVATAPPLPTELTGREAPPSFKELAEVARKNTQVVAAALRRRKDDPPYSQRALSNALRGLCPIWPFC